LLSSAVAAAWSSRFAPDKTRSTKLRLFRRGPCTPLRDGRKGRAGPQLQAPRAEVRRAVRAAVVIKARRTERVLSAPRGPRLSASASRSRRPRRPKRTSRAWTPRQGSHDRAHGSRRGDAAPHLKRKAPSLKRFAWRPGPRRRRRSARTPASRPRLAPRKGPALAFGFLAPHPPLVRVGRSWSCVFGVLECDALLEIASRK